jgi:hypothetical protein
MQAGDHVYADQEHFGGRLLGPSGSQPYSPTSPDGPDIEIWAVEDTRTLEVRHIRQDHLRVIVSRLVSIGH